MQSGNIWIRTAAVAGLVLGVLLTGCGRNPAGQQGTDGAVMRAAAGANPEATYTWLAANVFAKSCAGCHGAGSAAGKVDLSSYNAILTGPNQIVVAGNPAKSILFTVVNTGAMPKRAAKLPADQIQAISDWIAGGALNN